MDLLQSLDIALFRFINGSLRNSLFDSAMPFISGNQFFYPILLLLAIWLIWKCGARGRLFVLFMLLAIAIGDGVICKLLKTTVDRLRPFAVLENVHLPPSIGKTGSGSFPSSHSANWFAATMVAYIFYRRTWRFMLPLACLVAFSRVYNGVHFPSDVLGGAILGAGYAFAIVWITNFLWQTAGKRWFPLWHEKVPSLVAVECEVSLNTTSPQDVKISEKHWLRLGYILTFLVLFGRLLYLASGKLELSEDEAYQWLWSKHIALSYYSKPPLIAYTQWLGTHIWGDNAFGVRFFSPIITALASLLLLRFFAKEINARVGVFLLLATTAAPMVSAGAILMTIDPLSVMFWVAAMISGWRAVQLDSTKQWLWTGLWMGLGFLSKYTALFQLLCWAVFFVLWKPACKQLGRPGFWLALVVMVICAIPVLIWNAQNGWPTVTHLASRAGLEQQWKPTLNFFQDFVLAELGLLNPIFLVLVVWAAIAFWRSSRRQEAHTNSDERNQSLLTSAATSNGVNTYPLLVYFFSMGAPLFLVYFFYTFRARVQPNWIAPSILPLFCLAVIYWESRWREGARAVKTWFIAGLLLGITTVVLLHETRLIAKVSGRQLPAKSDPLTRVRGWRTMAEIVNGEREKLLAEGKPVFILGAHYGITGLLSFYLPEAKAKVSSDPLVFYPSSEKPLNQFYFWPGYRDRKGQNALYVQKIKAPGGKQPPPEILIREFESITDVGEFEIVERGKTIHLIHIFACRNLK